MKKLVSGLLFSMSLCGCGGSGSTTDVTSPPPPPPPPSGPWATVDSDLAGFLSSNAGADQVAGYAFMVVGPNGQLHITAGGNDPVLHGKAFTTTTQQPIASASKLPSALAILTLVDNTTIDLDTPIYQYLNSSSNSTVHWPDNTSGDNKSLITMRMLLNHTSGLPGLDHQSDANFPSCVNEDNTSAPTTGSVADCVKTIASSSTPLENTPGQVFDYGGADFQVAGYVAMVMSGNTTWQGFFNSAFATPMGLDTNAFTYGDPATVTNPRIAGGVTTDVSNYAKILQMLLNHGVAPNGNTILGSSTLANFRANQILGGPAQPTDPNPLKNFYPPNLTPAADYPGYSFGLFFSASSLYSPSLGPEFSDPGSYGTTPWIDLDSGSSATLGAGAYAAILLINNGPATPVGVDIWNAVRGDVQTAVTSG